MPPHVIVGIDTGGTNVDGVLLDEEVIATAQVPGDVPAPVEQVLDRLLDDGTEVERVVVVTTLVLNAAVQGRLPGCTNVLVPGPGLHPRRAFHGEQNHVAEGCIDPRGRVTEPVAYDGSPDEDVVAVTAKFGPRNPEPEEDLTAVLDYPPERVSIGSASGPGLTFPERAATTVANAKARPTFAAFERDISAALDAAGVDAPVYFLKGDGALLSAAAMRSTPAHALHGGPAASALGLVALSGIEDAVCVDIGGTTTDVIRVSGGFPTLDTVGAGPLDTGYEGVEAETLPVGGDSRVLTDGLADRREGNAAAFGGDAPTLTDALHVAESVDSSLGDDDAARAAFQRFDDPQAVASEVVASFVDRVAEAVDSLASGPTRLVAGGVLARYLADRVAGAAGQAETAVVPDHAAVAGAVGCAVARVSVETQIRIDSAQGTVTVSSVGTRTSEVEQGRTFDDEEIDRLAVDHARGAAREAGATAAETLPVEVLHSRRFNVVEDAEVAGQIVDATAQVTPGLRDRFGGDA